MAATLSRVRPVQCSHTRLNGEYNVAMRAPVSASPDSATLTGRPVRDSCAMMAELRLRVNGDRGPIPNASTDSRPMRGIESDYKQCTETVRVSPDHVNRFKAGLV